MLITPGVVDRCLADEPLPWLGGLRPSEFLRDYWQKKPLLVRNAFPALEALLEPAELLELAETEGAESRLIIENGKEPWELRDGPFHETTWRKLPKTGWTALVQAVDHYLPPLADLLDHFSFIPAWRIDDVMVSYAVPGGSVGPHFDQYDVFLIQGPGERRWQLGDPCDDSTPRQPHAKLKLLADMPVRFDEVLGPGDLLYVPPGLAHNGVAASECLTYSVGFRAPALSHLLEHWVDAALESGAGRLPYQDAGRAPSAAPAGIADADLDRLRAQVLALLQGDQLLDALAPSLSEPKYGDYEPEGEPVEPDDLRDFLADGGDLLRDPASRLLWLPPRAAAQEGRQEGALWINGAACDVPEEVLPWMSRLVNGRRLPAALLADAPEAVLEWLCEQLELGHWLPVDGLAQLDTQADD